jgi:serine/threonine-protein kinase 24/25/MST4
LNQRTGELVAIKVLDLEASDDDMDEIQKEIAVLSNCESEFITRYHGSYLVGAKLWIVMDYGANLII